MVLIGVAIALIPGLQNVQLTPEIVFLIFLPPLLYTAVSSDQNSDSDWLDRDAWRGFARGCNCFADRFPISQLNPLRCFCSNP